MTDISASRTISGRAYRLALDNVDTDVIIGAKWLKGVSRAGLGRGAFESIRQSADNCFDRAALAGAPILVAGSNFGCGSSREHAVWAITDLGVQAIIAKSFGDIFRANCAKNGLVTIQLDAAIVDHLLGQDDAADISVVVGTEGSWVDGDGVFPAEVDAMTQARFLFNEDEISASLRLGDVIAAHEARLRADAPWLAALGGQA